MTNTVALYIVVLIVAAMAVDHFFNDGAALLFLARKFLDLMEWVIFWN